MERERGSWRRLCTGDVSVDVCCCVVWMFSLFVVRGSQLVDRGDVVESSRE